MKLLLIGANSYLGARLYFDLKHTFNTIGTYHTTSLSNNFLKLDITNEEEIKKIFQEHKPDIVLHTANFASSRNAINNENSFEEVNLKATEFIVNSANEYNAKVIFISSFAALNTSDVYGEFKLKSENIVKRTKKNYLIIRPSLIVGFSPNTVNDRPFNRILRCIDSNQKAEFDTSWEFKPTYIGHVSQIIEQAVSKNIWNQTIHVIIDETVTQYQLATDILKAFNISVSPIDKKMKMPEQKVDLSNMNQFSLLPNTYHSLIETIIEEINNRDTCIV